MFYCLAHLLSDISELLISFASQKIDIEHLHQYVCDDIDMYIKLNSFFYSTKFTPSPAAMSGKRKEKKCQYKTKL